MTRFLLDTHAVLHWQLGTAMPPALSDDLDVANRSGLVLVSAATQARSLRAVLVSRDAVFEAYDVATRWA